MIIWIMTGKALLVKSKKWGNGGCFDQEQGIIEYGSLHGLRHELQHLHDYKAGNRHPVRMEIRAYLGDIYYGAMGETYKQYLREFGVVRWLQNIMKYDSHISKVDVFNPKFHVWVEWEMKAMGYTRSDLKG